MAEQKMPPKNIEAERNLLGALLMDKAVLVLIAEFLLPEHFYDSKHALIYKVMLELLDAGAPVDIVTVTDKLRKKRKLRAIGGVEYLSKLAAGIPTAAHAEEYATIVKELSIRRSLISAASKLHEFAFNEEDALDVTMDKAEQLIFALSQERVRDRFKHIKELLKESYERVEKIDKSKDPIGIKTGFTDLDVLLGGFQDSDLIILAARPSVGKTSLALDIARYVAMEEKKVVAFFSLEMSEIQLMDRLLAMEAGVGVWALRTGKLLDEEYQKLGVAYGRLADANIYIDDKPGQSIMELRAKARRLKAEAGIDLVIVDYLQLLRSRGLENRVQEISEVSMGLKNLARELNVPVVALSQLSRGVESRQERIPQLSDLRDSGSIEQDADVVMFIHREELYKRDTEKQGIADIIVAKHRNGPIGRVELAFVKELSSFRNLHKE